MSQNNRIFLGVARYQTTLDLKNVTVIDGFHFSCDSTLDEFVSDVNKLVEIIEENNIDVINAHPFYSLYSAIFAANITNTKLLYTCHGISSVNFYSRFNDSVLFSFAVENTIGKVLCTSKLTFDAFNRYGSNRAIWFPNMIDETQYTEHIPVLNRKWALVSRLDDDKYPEIIRLFEMLPDLDIDGIDVYGDGSRHDDLASYVKEHDLPVVFKGYSNDIDGVLKNYIGVIGTGRAALEGLVMGYPVMIIGYGKVVGLVDKYLYNDIKQLNFVANTFPKIETVRLASQINEINNGKFRNYILRNNVINDFSINRNINIFLDSVNHINFSGTQVYRDMFNELCALNGNKKFFESKTVFEILYKYIGGKTTFIDLKIQMNIMMNIVNLRRADRVYRLKRRVRKMVTR